MNAPIGMKPAAGTPVDAATQREIEALLLREADLLDDKQWEAWDALYTAEALYWVPGVANAPDPDNHVFIFRDNAEGRNVRIHRLRHPRNLVEEVPTRTLHIVQNVAADAVAGDTYEVRSRLLMLDWQNGTQRLYGGRVRHVVVRQDGVLKIAFKRVDLLNCDGVLPMISTPF